MMVNAVMLMLLMAPPHIAIKNLRIYHAPTITIDCHHWDAEKCGEYIRPVLKQLYEANQ